MPFLPTVLSSLPVGQHYEISRLVDGLQGVFDQWIFGFVSCLSVNVNGGHSLDKQLLHFPSNESSILWESYAGNLVAEWACGHP